MGPLWFNFSQAQLRSISVGRPGGSFKIPESRGGARTTVELPGTGLCWSVEHGSVPALRWDCQTSGGCGPGNWMSSSSQCLMSCASSCSQIVRRGSSSESRA